METNHPIPAPRPRRAVTVPLSSDTTDSSSAYENVTLNTVVKNFQELQVEEKATPIPAPRRVKANAASNYENTEPSLYPNLKGMHTMQLELEASLAARSTGAIKKTQNIPQSSNVAGDSPSKAPNVPNIPTTQIKLNNEISEASVQRPSSPKASGKYDFGNADLSSNSSMMRSKSQTSLNSSNSSNSKSNNSEGKFKTQSPSDIFKSIGSTSKLLGESLGERFQERRKSAQHKVEKNLQKSKNKLENWGQETKSTATKKLKNVRLKMSNISPITMSLKRNAGGSKKSSFDEDRPQTMPADDPIFQSISFNSPLNNKLVNQEDLPTASSSYEVPKTLRRPPSVPYDPPTYEEAITGSNPNFPKPHETEDFFQRNVTVTQSMYSQVIPGKKRDVINPDKGRLKEKIKSETDLTEALVRSSSESSLSDNESLPAPNFPPPLLKPEEDIYGKIRKVINSNSSPNVATIEMRKYDNVDFVNNNFGSNRATLGSLEGEGSRSRIFSRQLSITSNMIQELEKRVKPVDKSDSWTFFNVAPESTADTESIDSNEPIYANEDHESYYGKISEMKSNLMTPERSPVPGPSAARRSKIATSLTRDILNEFDPLNEEHINNLFPDKSNHLVLLETLLAEDTYGSTDEPVQDYDEDSSVDSINASSVSIPSIPAISDINDNPTKSETLEIPKLPPRPQRKEISRQKSVIVHQNMNLHTRTDSVENLVDEEIIEAHLAVVPEMRLPLEPVDLSKPSTSNTSKSSWFVNNLESKPDNFIKNNLLPFANEKISNQSFDKTAKTIPKLPKNTNNEPESKDYLPTYNESMLDEVVTPSSPLEPERASESIFKSNSVISMFSNVINRNLKRKSSLKRNEVQTLVEMVPKPLFTDYLAEHRGHLFRLPSGVIQDILKELSPRIVILKQKTFSAYLDIEQKQLKEQINLTFLTSIQCVINHKFTQDGGSEVHCFELNLAVPKNSQTASNPNLVVMGTNAVNTKTQRLTYVYGIHSKSEKFLWMHKILRSLTTVFPSNYSGEFTRAGWCYMKKSITSEWTGAWLVLTKRKLAFYNYTDNKVETMDLRKARCIGLKDHEDSIGNLHVEKGPMLLIDCPPFTIYFVMNSPRETKIWGIVLKDEAFANGPALKQQQLTKDNVPVIVDKCINFIYAHGSMSEGIYRKSGATNNVQKLLSLFRNDAFSVQITRGEYNEHDVSSALKKFMRDLPESLFGKLVVNFISVSEMTVKVDKIAAYRDLLSKLPRIEYQTIKKIIGHLNFVQSQKATNKMSIDNLAMIWGPTLMQDSQNDKMVYSHKEIAVLTDLVQLYKNLYEMSVEEIKKEQIMLQVLKNYHSAAENLSDSVKQSGDLQVWITLDPTPEGTTKPEDKQQCHCTLNPKKTVYDICKELAGKMKMEAHRLTMMEVILNGELQRPLHHNENVLNTVLRWTSWPESDRKSNYLELRPQTKFMVQIERALKTLPSLTPNSELKFADRKTKTPKSYILELIDSKIIIMKREKSSDVKFKEINIDNILCYLGIEKKRDSNMRWGLTMIQLEYNKRSRESPYIGSLVAGNNTNDQIVWYTSIFYSQHGTDIAPNPEMVIT